MIIYKFKDWHKTETRGIKVTKEIKEARANEIAEILSDSDRWHSHSRGINMKTLIDEVNLRVEDLNEIPDLGPIVSEYYELIRDYMQREQIISFVHSKEYF